MMNKVPIPSPLLDTLSQAKEQRPITNNTLSFARNDLNMAFDFLKQYDGNQATYNCYRREVERLLQWAWLCQKKSILTLSRADIENYIQFCLKPPKTWIALKKVPRFINNSGKRVANHQWRPFVVTLPKSDIKHGRTPSKNDYALSQKATREIFVALGSFYSYLMTENILEINPVLQIRQKSKYIRKRQNSPKIPRLSQNQWQAMINAAERMAEKCPEKHERTLFMISCLYLMYLRISELVASDRWEPLMKHFYQDSHGNWWFMTVGKGNKERHITVSDGMLDALKRWRRHLGLIPKLPTANDNSPLIPKSRGQGGISSTRWVNSIIQNCFDQAITLLRENDELEEAEGLTNATVHWLRHTGISDDINRRHRPIVHVRDDAGHASIATTDRYNDITLQERHASAKNKVLDVDDVI